LYPKTTYLVIKDYTDSYWANNIDDRKRTSGGAFLLGIFLVSWLGKKKTSISLSKDKASCCTQVLWIKSDLVYIQVPCEKLVSIMFDNKSAINLYKNIFQHSKTKHIPIKYHFSREQVQDRVVKLEYFPSNEKIAYIYQDITQGLFLLPHREVETISHSAFKCIKLN
jgi:hypothetical protein